jgi:hypothetical protein
MFANVAAAKDGRSLTGVRPFSGAQQRVFQTSVTK